MTNILKRISILFLIVLLCFAFCGCDIINASKLKAYNVTPLCDHDPECEATQTIEYYFREKDVPYSFNDEKAEKEKVIEFNGAQYKGKYLGSKYPTYSAYPILDYNAEGASLHIDSKTGKLWSAVFRHIDQGDKSISIEERRKIADDIVKDYINITDYTVKVEEIEKDTMFVYNRFKDLRSVEYISVTVDSGGAITTINLENAGAFSNTKETDKRVELLVSDEAKEVLGEKVYSMFKTYDYEITSTELVKTKEDEIGIVYRIKANEEEAKLSEDLEARKEDGKFVCGCNYMAEILIK